MNTVVDLVIELYLGLPDVAARRASRLDRQLAAELLSRGVNLEQIEAALLLAHLRRAARSKPLPPIRSLHYFLPVVDEITAQPLDPNWLNHLRARCYRR